MSDPTLSDIDFKNKKVSVQTTLKNEIGTFSVLLLLLSSILVGWSDWLTNIGGWIWLAGGLGFSPVVDWSPGIGSILEFFTLPWLARLIDDTRAFLYAPEFVRYVRTGGPDGINFLE